MSVYSLFLRTAIRCFVANVSTTSPPRLLRTVTAPCAQVLRYATSAERYGCGGRREPRRGAESAAVRSGKDFNRDVGKTAQTVVVGQEESAAALDRRGQVQGIAKFVVVGGPNPAGPLVNRGGHR